ncbi:hypothetical protein BHM03_00061644, partial [Ensete ventricosum]
MYYHSCGSDTVRRKGEITCKYNPFSNSSNKARARGHQPRRRSARGRSRESEEKKRRTWRRAYRAGAATAAVNEDEEEGGGIRPLWRSRGVTKSFNTVWRQPLVSPRSFLPRLYHQKRNVAASSSVLEPSGLTCRGRQ